MGKGIQGAVLKTLGAKEHALTVVRKEYRAPHFVRVWMRSETLLQPEGEQPGNWIRAWFPDPEGSSKEFQRGYTLAETDPSNGLLAVDFVLHEPKGPASHWASNCKTGDVIAAMRYGEQPFELLDPPPKGYLFLGDLASYPAIFALAQSIPQERQVIVILEQHSEYDVEVPLPKGPNIQAHWVKELPNGSALAQALSGRDWTGWYAWVTAETVATRQAKTLLQNEFGLNRSTLHSQAYWVRGRAMGKSRSLEEQDVLEVSQEADAFSESENPQQSILAPAKPAFIVGGIIQAILAVLQIMPFILFAEVARLFMEGGRREEFVSLGMNALIILGITTGGSSILLLFMHLLDARFAAMTRQRIMGKISSLPLGWFADRKSSDVKKLVSDDVTALHYLITHAALDLVAAIVTPLAALVYLFYVQWRLALVLLVPIAVFIYVMMRISIRDRAKVTTSQRYIAIATGQAQTYLNTRQHAQIFGPSSVVPLPKTLQGVGDFIAGWQKETALTKIRAVMINRPITVLGILVLTGWLFVQLGWCTPVDLIPFLILGTSFGGQLIGISTNIGAVMDGLETRNNLEVLLATPSLTSPRNREVPAGHVCFRDVTFGYSSGDNVLEHFNLELEKGKITAIVGSSGAGKSTIATLLARLWDPQSGSVSIDGKDIRDLSQDELYAKVTILLQDVQLIRATVRENIALTRPEASDEDVIAAAKAASIHHVIAELPQGYETIVDSSRLSGGERQRIGIARALLADTPIVILDEATAAADPDSEWAIRQGLNRLLQGRTVVMIAHRLHTIRDADRIIVLERGAIVEDGTHNQLMHRGGVYANLWRVGASSVEEENKC